MHSGGYAAMQLHRPAISLPLLRALLFPITEPAQQAQSHCCASAQQSHLSFGSNLTAAHAAISLRPVWGTPSTPLGVLHCGLCPLFISHRKVASSLRRIRSSLRALASRIDEPPMFAPLGRTIMPRYHVKLSCEPCELSCKERSDAQ